jgi:hypothetical protein
MTAFYKKADNAWILGNYRVPPKSCYMRVDPVTGAIEIKSFWGGLKFSGDNYSEFTDSSGNAYGSLNAFETAIDGFFTCCTYPA